MAVSNSNNMIVTTPEPHSSMIPEGRSNTLSHITDDHMEYTLHSETHAKIPMSREDPNFEASGSKKFHNKKVFDSPMDVQPSNLLSHPPGNVPHFSIINEDSHSQPCKNLESENDMKQSNINTHSQFMPQNTTTFYRINDPSSQIPQQLANKNLSNSFQIIENVKNTISDMETDDPSEPSIESSFSFSFLKKITDSQGDDSCLDQAEYVPLAFLKSQSLKRHNTACSDMEVKTCSETITNKLSDSQIVFSDSQRDFSVPHCQEPHPEHFHPVCDNSPSRDDAPQLTQPHLYRHTPPPQHLNLSDCNNSQVYGVSEQRDEHYMAMNPNFSVSQRRANPSQTFLSEHEMKYGFFTLPSPQCELQESIQAMRTLPPYKNHEVNKSVVPQPGMNHQAVGANDLFRPAPFSTYTLHQTNRPQNEISAGKRAGSTRSDSTRSDTTRADSTRSDVSRSDTDREQRYNYIDNNQVTSVRENDAVMEELSRLEGWCPGVHGQNVSKHLHMYV